MNIEELILKFNEITDKHDQGLMNIHYILKVSDNCYKALASSKADPDLICEVIYDNEFTHLDQIPDWDYSIQEYLLYDLENYYEIIYCPIETHCDLWKEIDYFRDEIYRKNGLQLYLKYCEENKITPQIIKDYSNEDIDITDLNTKDKNKKKGRDNYEQAI